MSGQNNGANKKTMAIVAIIIAVLLVIAISGTVMFLNNKGQAEAANLNASREVENRRDNSDDTQNPTDVNQPSEDNNSNVDENNGAAVVDDENNTTNGDANNNNDNTPGAGAAQGGNNAQNNNNNNNNTQGNNGTVENIQETTITREEVVEIPERQISEGHYVGWTTMDINAEMASAKIKVKYVDITGVKSNDLVADEKGEKIVKPGDTFNYTITLSNTGNTTGKVTVTDEVPAELKVVSTTPDATVEGNKVDFGDVKVVPGEETVLTISVKVKAEAKGTINNVALVDGTEVPDPEDIKTANITGVKLNNIVADENGNKVVKPGDTFNYTITLTNNGNAAGKVTVTDEVPAELEVVSTDPTAVVEENKVDFGEVEVAAEATKTLTIAVKVKAEAKGTIKNIALVDGEKTPDPEDIKTANITGTKSNDVVADENGNKVVKPGDTFNYIIKLNNSGNAAGKVTVTDEVPAELEIVSTDPTAVVEGNKVNFGEVEVAAGKTKTLTISVKVKAEAKGTINNVALVDGEEVPDPEDIKTANITGTKSNDVVANKNGEKVVKPGDEFNYTITLSNSGNAAGKVIVTDEVPAELEVVSTTPSVKVEGNKVNFGEVEVAAGATEKLTITVKVKAEAKGTINNVALVDGKEVPDPEDIKAANITGTKSNDVVADENGNKVVKPGDTFNYTITLTNSGNAAGKVTVTDEVPAELEVVSTTPSVKVEGNLVNFGEVEVAAGATKTLTINVKVKTEAKGTIKNVALVDGEEVPDPEDIKTANITGTKSNDVVADENGNKVVKPGDTFNYTITLSNSGNTAGKVTVTDEVPAELKVVSTTPSATVEGNKVDFGEVKVTPGKDTVLTIKVEVKAEAKGTIKNIALVDGEEVPDPEDIKTANITGTKSNNSVNGKVKPGDEFNYTITLSNSGNAAGKVTVTDEVPAKLEVVSTDPTAVVEGNKVNFGEIEIAAGSTEKLTITVKVKADATGTINNIALVDGNEVPDPGIEVEDTPIITATKEHNDEANTVKPGEEITYTIKLSNSGNAKGITTVTDTLPAGVTIKQVPEDASYDEKTRTVTWSDVEVTVGTNTKVLTLVVTVDATTTGTIENTATVGKEPTKDPDPVVVEDVPVITATKEHNDEANTVKPGEEITYTIKLSNSGNAKGTTTVTDTLPAGVTIKEVPEGASYDAETRTVTWSNVEVTVGVNTKVLTLVVTVDATTTGTIENTATVGKEPTKDPDPVVVEDVPVITGIKTNNDSDRKVKPGDTVTYSIKLSNSGNAKGTITVTDTLPTEVTFVKATEGGNYNAETRTVTWSNVEVTVGTDTKVLEVEVTINETATRKIVNTAVIDNKEEHDEGLDLVKITATKTNNVEGTAKVGQEVVYTIKAVNNGTVAGDAVITDTIPSGLRYVTAYLTNAGEDTISYENGIVTWNVKDLAVGEANARELTIKATIEEFEGTTKSITNTVKVDDKETDKTTVEVGKPVIVAEKSSSIISCERNELTGTKVHEGDQIQYTIKVRNDGTVEKSINIEDQIKDGLTYVDGTLSVTLGTVAVEGAKVENGIVKLTNYTLEPGSILTITFTVQVNELEENQNSKTIDTNVAVVDGTDVPDGDKTFEVLKPNINTVKESQIVSCSKNVTEGTIVHEGDQIEYTITVSNTGDASGKVTLEDTIKDGLTFVPGSLSAEVNGTQVPVNFANGKVSLTNYDLAAKSTLVITFRVSVNTLPDGQYSKTIEANVVVVNGTSTTDESGEYDVVKPNIESNKTSTIKECSVNKTEGNKVHGGDVITYTITVANTGTDSSVINVTDQIPAGVTYKEGTLSATLQTGAEVTSETKVEIINNNKVNLEAYTLNGGSTLTITFDVTVDELDEGTYYKAISNNVAVVNGNDVPDDGGYEIQKPQIEASKEVDKQEAEYGDILTYTISVRNISTVEAEVNVVDPIPAGTEFVAGSITINGTPVSDATNYKDGKVVYTETLANINDTLTITFQVKVTETELHKEIINVANINGEERSAKTELVKTVTVGTESTKVTPIDLVLVLDTSGSMNNNGKLTSLISNAKTLVDAVFEGAPESTISVVTYAKEASDKGTYSKDEQNKLKNDIIDKLTANDGTNIYAALEAANEKVSSLSGDRPKVVVFLTDGTPTIPDYISGVHSSDNRSTEYTNNVKNEIVSQADTLKSKATVYSIGLGLNNLSESNVRSASECTVIEETINVISDIQINQENNSFTVTITNSENHEVTLNIVSAKFSNIDKLTKVNEGGSRRNDNMEARWENVKIPANGTITLTGTYKPENRRTPSATLNVSTTIKTCISEEHQEMFNGKPLYSVVKTANGKQYHGIVEKDYANYLLSKISSTGNPMNVSDVSTAFAEIINDLKTTSKTYKVGEGTVISIPETNNIISKVTVEIGESSNEYTLDEIKSGNVEGLTYIDNVGFEWTISGDNLLTNNISLKYKIDE